MSKPIYFVLMLLTVLQNNFAQPGYDCTEDYQQILKLTLEITEHPDSTELHEQRLLLNHECGNLEYGLEDIDHLLNKSPNSKKYLLDKVYLYLKYSYLDSIFTNSTIVFENYFEVENDPCEIRTICMRIGQTYFYKNQFEKAINYYNKALNTKGGCYYEDEKIIYEKKELYHDLNQYDKAYEMLKQIDEFSLEAIRYNTIYIKDYKTSKENIYTRINKFYKENKTGTEFIFPTIPYHLKKDILELAYIEYKLDNEEAAVNLLYNFVTYDYKNLFISTSEVYPPYWCMYIDLYKKYKDDYRIHLVTSYLFTKESHNLVSFKHNDQACKPKNIINIDFLSWNDMKKKINMEALQEIEIAEKLTSKKFDLYRAITLREMEDDDKSIKILKKLIAQNPNDISVNRAISLSYLSRSKSNPSLDHRKYMKYRKKTELLTKSNVGFILKIKP